MLLKLGYMVLLGSLCTCAGATGGRNEERSHREVGELLTLGRQQTADMELRDAIASFRMVLHRDSTNADALAGLAQVYRLQRRPTAAEAHLRAAIFSTYAFGLERLEEGDEEAAVAGFEHAIRIHPDHTLALIELGKIALGNRRNDEALAYFQKAHVANPDYSQVHVNLGNVYTALERFDEAKVAYERAVKLNANAVGAYTGLGNILSRRQDWAESVRQYEKALFVDPDSEAAQNGLRKAQANL